MLPQPIDAFWISSGPPAAFGKRGLNHGPTAEERALKAGANPANFRKERRNGGKKRETIFRPPLSRRNAKRRISTPAHNFKFLLDSSKEKR
jgi:hypothetical protein